MGNNGLDVVHLGRLGGYDVVDASVDCRLYLRGYEAAGGRGMNEDLIERLRTEMVSRALCYAAADALTVAQARIEELEGGEEQLSDQVCQDSDVIEKQEEHIEEVEKDRNKAFRENDELQAALNRVEKERDEARAQVADLLDAAPRLAMLASIENERDEAQKASENHLSAMNAWKSRALAAEARIERLEKVLEDIEPYLDGGSWVATRVRSVLFPDQEGDGRVASPSPTEERLRQAIRRGVSHWTDLDENERSLDQLVSDIMHCTRAALSSDSQTPEGGA
jgi:hypothetical protein